MLSDPISSPNFLRRRRQVATTTNVGSINKTTAGNQPNTPLPQPRYCPPSAAPVNKAPKQCSLVTTTSSNDRLHLVLTRRTKSELSQLHEELSQHTSASSVCVYSDSPLVSNGSFSRRQTTDLLTRAALQCKQMKTLQLDFSNEFGPQREVYLKISLLRKVLEEAPQLTTLLLKDVPLRGDQEDMQELRRALKQHKFLGSVQLKWCLEAKPSQPMLPSLLESLAEDCSSLQELTLLVSCGEAKHLPLPSLAKSKSIRKFKVAIEQRHLTWQSVEDLQQEQHLVLEFLDTMKTNQIATELTLYAQHWKPNHTLKAVIDLVESSTSTLHKIEMFEYTYGNDKEGKQQLLHLAQALRHNPNLQHFKLHTKRSPGATETAPMDKKVYQAMLECAQENVVLELMEISHCDISLSTNPNIQPNSMYPDICRAIEFYVRSNRNGVRRRFLQQDFSAAQWLDFVSKEGLNDTPLVFYLLQSNPNLLLSRHKVVFES